MVWWCLELCSAARRVRLIAARAERKKHAGDGAASNSVWETWIEIHTASCMAQLFIQTSGSYRTKCSGDTMHFKVMSQEDKKEDAARPDTSSWHAWLLKTIV